MSDAAGLRAFVEALVAAGVREAVVCPGSRSTPLALALRAAAGIRVRVLYDEERLYLGVFCYDREPQKIAAKEMRRDAGLNADDSFFLVPDTFGDRRSA